MSQPIPLNQSDPQLSPNDVSLTTYNTYTIPIPIPISISLPIMIKPPLVQKDIQQQKRVYDSPKILLNKYQEQNLNSNNRLYSNSKKINQNSEKQKKKKEEKEEKEEIEEVEEVEVIRNKFGDIIELYIEDYKNFHLFYIIFGIFMSICLTIIKNYS